MQRRVPKIARLNREYNELCDDISKEILAKRAPTRAIAPEKIESKNLFKLDVDDAIWQDVGLGDDADTAVPPLWLSSETVRSGIKAMLVLDRAKEEDVILKKERRAMRLWFAEGWTVVSTAMENSGTYILPFTRK